ncbi:hypothetical protein [Ruminiclostridium cellobioparum]|jgi:hypothetical protein|uniref:hypothetical protein n=1 Tax=Ruminiclostridium cellobioparum TaxID=29355 RepID=UPI000482B142|nr:hypothetical protein [Ruminiclostridium cellobioparum]
MYAIWQNSSCCHEQDGENLEAIGGYINITLETLQDKQKRSRITSKIREFAECTDKVLDF